MNEHHRRVSTLLLFLVMSFLVFFSMPVSNFEAQSFYGSVLVVVGDSSGGVIPDASVALINIGTNEKRTGQSDATGTYRFVNLVPANYRLEVEMAGFKRMVREPIVVQVEGAVRIDAVLEIGAVNETVEVSAETPLLQTETASLGQVIEGRHVLEMPLNGRNSLNLIALVPEVVAQGSTSGSAVGNQQGTTSGARTSTAAWNNYQIGGGAAGQSAIFLDGTPLNVIGGNAALVPTQDAVQEFRVVTNNVSSEFGRFAGGVVNMTTKSGANAFHGSAYEYLRNDKFNANYFFSNKTGQERPHWLQNQYGGTIGGPVIKDKTFFFFSWEGFKSRIGIPSINNVPYDAYKRGDFSSLLGAELQGTDNYNPCTGQQRRAGEIYDPTTTRTVTYNGKSVTCRTPFTNNIIPANRIDSTANYMANTYKYWPSPNMPNQQFVYTAPAGSNSNQYNVRLDQNISDKQRIFGRFTYWTSNDIPYNPLNTIPSAPGKNKTYNVVLGDTYSFNPTTILDVHFSYLRQFYISDAQSVGVDLSSFGSAWAALAQQMTYTFLPRPQVSGYYSFGPIDNYALTHNNSGVLSANLTKLAGGHTFKFGGDVRLMTLDNVSINNGAGTFVFNTANTSYDGTTSASAYGQSFASFMLGAVSTNGGTISTTRPTSAYQWYQGYFFNDTFQLTKKLTLNYGVRWELSGAVSEKYNRANVLLPGEVDPLSQSTGLNLKGVLGLVNSALYSNRSVIKPKSDLFAPRVGFAYRVNDQTVLRAGYGINYLPTDLGGGSPYSNYINSASTVMSSTATLSNPFPLGINQPLNTSSYLSTLVDGQSVSANIPDQPISYVQQWNLNIEHQMPRGVLVETGYAGSKGTHLPMLAINQNQLDPSYYSLGSQLTQKVNNPFYGILPASSTLGGKTIAYGQLLRPYPQYVNYYNASPRSGDSDYHAFHIKVEKRFGAGGVLMGNYTWSKMISSADSLNTSQEYNSIASSYQNNTDISSNRSLSAYTVPHRAVISYVLDLPFGRNKKYLSGLSGIKGNLVSGWGINGITIFQTGFPLIFQASATTISSSFGGGTPRPNVVPGCVSEIAGPAQSRLDQWFNTACFTQPGTYSMGNESRVDPKLKAAGVNNFDFAVFKNTLIKEKVTLQFRAEAFNLFNRVQFYAPDCNLADISTTYGQVTAQVNQPRLIQFALRLTF